jgi:hypothetical protein
MEFIHNPLIQPRRGKEDFPKLEILVPVPGQALTVFNVVTDETNHRKKNNHKV